MEDLDPGTAVKTLRTNRDDSGQAYDHSGVVQRREVGERYESYSVSWSVHPTGVMTRDELELVTEEDRLYLLAIRIMES